MVDPNWDCRLHEMLSAPLPCREAAEFWTLWPEVIEALTAQGMRIGPASFGVWNDGEPELVRAVWCLTRYLRPTKVVETGVARGLTSRFILEALEKNETGHLWSLTKRPIDGFAIWASRTPSWTTAFSRARNELFRESDVLRRVFERIVETCIERAGWLAAKASPLMRA
jgi:hypothetical protein